MLNLVLFGPPGAGKGTQSAFLVERYHLVHLSTGDLFRYNIKNETELGVLAKSYMAKGITSMIALEAPEAELRVRLAERAKTSGRPDDADPAVIQNRIDVYNNETAPVKAFYEAQGKYKGINGVGSIEEITERLVAIIDTL